MAAFSLVGKLQSAIHLLTFIGAATQGLPALLQLPFVNDSDLGLTPRSAKAYASFVLIILKLIAREELCGTWCCAGR
jgi:hypothetical protein